ncbi:MAG: hypothetical protein AAF573_03870 [Bacteroidota bacterium]
MRKNNNRDRKSEGSIYDKIMRENLQSIFLKVLENKYNFKIESVETLPDKLPTTIGRETDSLLQSEAILRLILPQFNP